jgi:hypothetical protein
LMFILIMDTMNLQVSTLSRDMPDDISLETRTPRTEGALGA